MTETTIERLEAIRQRLLNEPQTVESLEVELLALIEALLEKA